MIAATLKNVFLGTLLLKGVLARPTDDYCGFYEDNKCERQSGSVTYSVNNDGIFQNGGPYFQCGTIKEFTLRSSPPGDSSGDTVNHCYAFSGDQASLTCNHLDDLGFTTGDGGYYRISSDFTCPSGTRKRSVEPEISARNVSLEQRTSEYFAFYTDPDCTVQSGSVHYSINNDGCFENGGPYGMFLNDDYDFAIEQFASVDPDACSGDVQHCVLGSVFDQEAGPGGSAGNLCVHLDDVGLQTGQGSYRILKGGCP